jgi:hypothetical protein
MMHMQYTHPIDGTNEREHRLVFQFEAGNANTPEAQEPQPETDETEKLPPDQKEAQERAKALAKRVETFPADEVLAEAGVAGNAAEAAATKHANQMNAAQAKLWQLAKKSIEDEAMRTQAQEQLKPARQTESGKPGETETEGEAVVDVMEESAKVATEPVKGEGEAPAADKPKDTRPKSIKSPIGTLGAPGVLGQIAPNADGVGEGTESTEESEKTKYNDVLEKAKASLQNILKALQSGKRENLEKALKEDQNIREGEMKSLTPEEQKKMSVELAKERDTLGIVFEESGPRLKESGPEKKPRTKGEQLKQQMDRAKANYEKGGGDSDKLLASLEYAGAMFQYMKLSFGIGGNLDDPLETGKNAEDLARKNEGAQKEEIRKEIEEQAKTGGGVDDVIRKTTQDSLEITDLLSAARTDEGTIKGSIVRKEGEIVQLAKLVKSAEGNTKTSLQLRLDRAETDIKSFQAKLEGTTAQISTLEARETALKDKLSIIKTMQKEAEENGKRTPELLRNTAQDLSRIENKHAQELATLLRELADGIRTNTDTLTLEIKASDNTILNHIQEITGLRTEETGMNADGSVKDPEKFFAALNSIVEKFKSEEVKKAEG